jgi:hypothetical protein
VIDERIHAVRAETQHTAHTREAVRSKAAAAGEALN